MKGVGVNPLSQAHYVDHLGVICILMGVPLLFTDYEQFELAKAFYPQLEAHFVDFREMTLHYLTTHYDVLYTSDLWNRDDFRQRCLAAGMPPEKNMRYVHCPHGFSDKGFYLQKSALEDVTLIYGQNMIDLLNACGVYDCLHQYVITGNYRYSYYQKHCSFFNALVEKEVLNRFSKKQKTLLYAPTWLDLAHTTTFFDAHAAIIGKLPDSYNLIVKLHPRLEQDDPVGYHQILSLYEHKSNVVFLKDFPLVYPLLAHTDFYLGDMSSIGYDFLAFDKPLFFLDKYSRNPTADREAYLFRCGRVITPEHYPQLYPLIEKHAATDQIEKSPIRQEVYRYTFGEEKSFPTLKKEILSRLQQEK